MKPLAFPTERTWTTPSITGVFDHYVSECGDYRVSQYRSDFACEAGKQVWHASVYAPFTTTISGEPATCAYWQDLARVRSRASAERHCTRHRSQNRKAAAAARKRGK